MSGRDLRTFLSDHRRSKLSFSRNEEGLLHTFLAGAPHTKRYKHVDYEKLLTSAKQQRASAEEQLKRVQSLSKRGKRSRETGLLKQHRDAWEREHSRLMKEKREAVLELEGWRADVVLHGSEELKAFVTEVTAYESELYDERQQFEADTVEPIWSLRADLKSCVESNWQGKPPDAGSEVLHELNSVKQQQKRIESILQSEFDELWSEMRVCVGEYLPDSANEKEVSRGIPPEALALECPDEELRESLLREFRTLDECYQAMLDQWEEENRKLLSTVDMFFYPLRTKHCERNIYEEGMCRNMYSLQHGGWSEVDAERFACVLEQYPSSMSNRRAVYIDRLLRELPHKTRTEIVDHESWYSSLAHYHTRRNGYIKSWAAHRRGLLERVATIFHESQREFEVKQHARAEREQQRKICRELCAKVSRWRQERLEVMRVEAEEAARVREEEETRRRVEEETERRRRDREKVKLDTYHRERDNHQHLERQEMEERRQTVRVQREEQARRNKERVEYRQELQALRERKEMEARERALQEQQDRERRLEVLRQHVQVDVPIDPVRVLRDTKASQARVAAHHEPERPLFPLHSFPDDVVTSDRRFRVAMALREAGLHDTTYARRIIAAIPPPLPPRPDQQSSLFK